MNLPGPRMHARLDRAGRLAGIVGVMEEVLADVRTGGSIRDVHAYSPRHVAILAYDPRLGLGALPIDESGGLPPPALPHGGARAPGGR